MTEVLMRGQVAERLQVVAKTYGLAVSELVDQALDLYLASSRVEHEQKSPSAQSLDEWEKQSETIAQEQAIYESQHAVLYKKYAGQFIAMHRGQVVDNDLDRKALSRRIRQRYGKQPILITPVLAEPRRTFHVLRPSLVRSAT